MLISKIYSRGGVEAPLVILVHGRCGNVDVMQAFKNCVPEGTTIVAVQAPLTDPEGGYRWWDFNLKLEFTEDSHVNAAAACDLFEKWLDDFLLKEQIRPSSICGVGFSQGAALLSYLIQIRPSLFSAVAMLAGFVVRTSQLNSQFTNKDIAQNSIEKLEVFVAHGTNDDTVPYSVACQGVEFLRGLGYRLSFISDPVGHKIGVEGMKALKGWLKQQLIGKLSSIH